MVKGIWASICAWFSEGAPRSEPSAPRVLDLGASEPGATVLFTLRKTEIARKFPLELPDDAVGPPRAEAHTCGDCGASLGPVVITTGGPYGDAATWQEHPIAIDGWRCEGCEKLTYPARLSDDEVQDLLREGTAAAKDQRFDDAELSLRRVVSSHPTFLPARVNLAAMYFDRIRQETDAPPELVARYTANAETQLRKALAIDRTRFEAMHMLARLLGRTGREDEARGWLRELLAVPNAPEAVRDDARRMLAEPRS